MVNDDILKRLYKTYGTNLELFLQENRNEINQSLESIKQISIGEIKHLINYEDVIHLDDLILRRTMIGKLGMITPEILKEIAETCAKSLNWSQQETVEEMERFTSLLRDRHKMNFNAFIRD